MKSTRGLFVSVLTALHAVGVLGDGVGFIGYGKTMYNPTCAFACRNVIKGCKLFCTPSSDTGTNHGTTHNPVSTPPDCFVQDAAFLQTMAICIDTYCPLSDTPSMALIDDYWASHLGTGSIGDYQWVPDVSYHDALAAGRVDEARLLAGNDSAAPEQQDRSNHGSKKLKSRQFMTRLGPNVTSPLPIIKAGAPLNTTSFIAPGDWQKQYNGMLDFEINENGHSTYTIAIMLVAILLPVPLSLLRFIPGITTSRTWNSIQSALINPAVYGKRHRQPAAGYVGLVPTRGQALYILLISLLNLVFLLAPYVYHHPQSTFPSRDAHELSIIGARAGVMAMGNVVALFLFAARNNVLLWVTDWSYGTYLLLHRWLGYWAVFHTVLHSLMMWFYYRNYDDYEAELVRDYWVWGIVATVAVVAIFPSSLLVVRQRLYEFFLASHVVLVLLFIVAYYYHIWFCYEYNWGYEIWAFIAAGIWATERLVRLVRIIARGYRTATVSLVDGTDREYLRIDIEGTQLEGGVAYLSFPTLGWRFWESHPFSTAFNSSQHEVGESEPSIPNDKTAAPFANGLAQSTGGSVRTITTSTTTFFARVRTGMTGKLATRAAAGPVRLGVVVDGPYHHSGDVATQLKQCSSVIYIAGGVGITALFPHIRQLHAITPARLFWATRKTGLANVVEPVLTALPPGVDVEVVVGQRLDVDVILGKTLAGSGTGSDAGQVGIVVCGPAGMADHVRHKVVQLARSDSTARSYVLVDEAFGW